MNTEYKLVKKITYLVNTVILLCILGLMAVFSYFHVDYMVYHSIPTFFCYIIFYFVINKNHLGFYLWSVYILITVYMSAATICMGVSFGFSLYCISMIPIVFYVNYMAYKMEARKQKSGLISVIIIISYLGSTGIALVKGPVYNVSSEASVVFYFINSMIVITFLLFYTSLIVRMVTKSDEQLSYMAHFDNLTGLYNRYCMMDNLKSLKEEQKLGWIAMLDIDKFKKINDNYGHAAGDYVLKTVSEIFRSYSQNYMFARWGGEEFLMIPKNPDTDMSVLEELRTKIETTEIIFENEKIHLTISAGAASFADFTALEKCIQSADMCLYVSKNTGRNRVTVQ